MLNLPLPDRAGRGALEQRIHRLVQAMTRVAHGRDPQEWGRLERQLDQARRAFHALYRVREHPTQAPLQGSR